MLVVGKIKKMQFPSPTLKNQNYCRKANAKHFFVDFAQNILNKKYLSKFGENFNLIIYNNQDKNKTRYYSIPYKDIKHLLITETLDEGRRWLANIANDTLIIKDKRYTHYVQKYYQEEIYNFPIENEPFVLDDIEKYVEGASKVAFSKKIERSLKARKACINFWKERCVVCDFSFLEKYGIIGKDFIHVHHLKPLSEINTEYIVDPIKDLRPVCPNCHAMLHKQNPPFTIEELRSMIK